MSLRYVGEVPSTQVLLGSAGHGDVVWTDRQLAGRGRRGSAWVSPPGSGLQLSIRLEPQVPVARLAQLSLLAGVAVAEVLGEGARLKWPNDVWDADDRKLAGILAEAELGERPHVVVGIGLNLTAAPLPEATCAADLGVHLTAEEAARAVRQAMLGWVERWKPSADALWSAWSARDALAGRVVVAGSVSGVAAGVDPSGALRVQTRDGLRLVHAGEVSVRPG